MRRIVLSLAVACVMASAAADEDALRARLDGEARGLLAQVVKDFQTPIGPCDLRPDWNDDGVPYNLAHRYLGLEIHANLRNPDNVADPQELLGALGVAKDAFCDEDAFRASLSRRVAAWQAAFRALPKGSKPPPGYAVIRRSISFPVFDSSFKRAMVMFDHTYWPYDFDDKGEVKRSGLEGGASALVYRRDGKGWHKIAEEEISNWD